MSNLVPKPTHIMVDLETFGTKAGAAIVAIGAVAFDPAAGTIGSEFLRRIDLRSAVACGLTIDPGTVLWWMEQGAEAQDRVFGGLNYPLPGALSDFWRFADEAAQRNQPSNCRPAPRPIAYRIWGHGATFDPVLLTAALEACGHIPWWGFRDVRDTRTLYDLAGIENVDPFRAPDAVKHDPLADAKAQALAAIEAYRRLGLARRPAAEAAHV